MTIENSENLLISILTKWQEEWTDYHSFPVSDYRYSQILFDPYLNYDSSDPSKLFSAGITALRRFYLYQDLIVV